MAAPARTAFGDTGSREAMIPSRLVRVRLGLTQFGTSYLLLVMLTLIGCVNYDLSLGYGLTFLLAGVWVITAGQAVRAARRLNVRVSPPPATVAGSEAVYTVHVGAPDRDVPLAVIVTTTQGDTRYVNARVRAGEPRTIGVAVPARVRGRLGLTSVRVGALDPLAIWQATIRPSPAAGDAWDVAVHPIPEPAAPPLPPRVETGVGDGMRRTKGDQEFAGLRPYVPGDSPRQVSWRHVARTGTLLTRETDAPLGSAVHLDWHDTAGSVSTELRVSRLAAWIATLRVAGQPFSLQLPGQALAPGAGDAHANRALDALAAMTPLPDVPTSKVGRTSAAVGLNPAAMRSTLIALAFALAPAVLREPVWITALIAGLLVHTDWRVHHARPPIPTWVLGVVAGVSAALLAGSYGTLLGRDAGTALLALLAALKTAESGTRRDANLLILLALFVASTHYFFGQGPLTALHSVLAAWALLAAAARWTVTAPEEPLLPENRSAVQAGTALALAIPLALTLFVLFPRPSGPLWHLAVQGRATTGLASEITAGEYSDLAQNRAVAFRADFQGPVPPAPDRYWRGPVYESYDGQRWAQIRQSSASASVDFSGSSWTYTMTLEPNNSPWLPVLDAPAALPAGTFMTTNFQAYMLRPPTTRERLTVQSRQARLGVREYDERLRYDQTLPVGESPRAVALAASWKALEPEDRVRAALAYFQQGGFTYTLSPPTLPRHDRVDAFLWDSKQGFCEHYASAFTFLMRAAGIPARIVGGYLGGELNPDGGYLIVRQQDAHAWSEVWLAGQGWVRVDPTALIAPARINAGVQTALGSPQATAAPAPNPVQRLQLRLDAIQNRWDDLIIGYGDQQQQSLLSRAGLGSVGSGRYVLAVLGLLLLALLPAALWRRRGVRPRDPAARALHDLTARLKLPREPGETPTAYAERARILWPVLGPALDAVVHAYHAARYAPGDGTVAQRDLRAAVQRVRRPSRTP
ncbi:transglutaminaseTgpA domain-containing protein [Deinococcus sp.]|uniref:transglutaminaseTgpA domain-containing protein n=1 Tax=Deinococcus sp. TaxID=47478 RepID=UPI002869DB59|nr:transglutaminaseTgpA domain-containing protein [Deinococcus sp.]